MLDRIIKAKREMLASRMETVSFDTLLESASETRPPSFHDAIGWGLINIIAEIKYRSPSHGYYRCNLPADVIAQHYADNGAAAISVLTDGRFFSGSLDILRSVNRTLPNIPLLRKDFIIDPWQVAEARAFGASAYLLIVACLEKAQLAELIEAGSECGITPLVEVHDFSEMEIALECGAAVIGVNNRNLKTLETSIETSFEIARQMENDHSITLVSESGIREGSVIRELSDAGFSAFLIGSVLMEARQPGKRLAQLFREAIC